MTDPAALLAFADELADAARAAILPYFRGEHGLENKAAAGFDPVTEADRASEKAMRALIEARFPTHGISGEEFGEKPSQDGYLWALDPIDGTRAFISGLPLWGVLIGLSFEGRPLIGVMDQPYLGERFRGFPGGAELVTRDGVRPLKTRSCAALGEATLSTTDPYLFKDAEAEAFARVRQAARLQRFGCDCYAYCMVALGTIDLVIESGLKMHDVAALIPIVEGAGGRMTTWDGGDALRGGRVLACGDARVHAEAMALLRG
ncbi:MAG: histidinol-phosphatase [Alphaproteobacteria bacterium]|nr:histidinol-phosphatase [Alphaproteobacteria bacterium]